MSAEHTALNCRFCGGDVRRLPSDGSYFCGNCHLPLKESHTEGVDKGAIGKNGDNADEASAPEDLSGPVLVQLARVQREEVRWLWSDRIPLGRLTGLVGDPGVGKSWLSLVVASAVTTGAALQGGQESPGEPGDVLLLTAEDGLADTVRPRMEDMRADLTRVTVLTAIRDAKGNERHPSLLADIPAMESVLAGGGYRLVIIDPLNAYLGVNLDTHRDAALRSALTPLAAMAERMGVAVLFVHHLNKGQRDRAIYRLQGSIAVVAAARVVHLVGMNPDDGTDRVFTCIKNNLALSPPALSFELTEGRFLWRGESNVTEAALLRGDEDEGKRSAQDEAAEFLRVLLGDGPVEAKQAQREYREVGISERTIMRAKAALGVKSERHGQAGQQGGGTWVWSLPDVKDVKDDMLRGLTALTPPDTKRVKSTSAVDTLNPEGDHRASNHISKPDGEDDHQSEQLDMDISKPAANVDGLVPS